MGYITGTGGSLGTRPLGTERDGPTLATGRRSLLPLAPTCTRRTASSRCGAAACGSPCRVARGLRRSRPSVRWRGPTALSSGTKRGGTQHIARSSTLPAASPYIASPLHPRPSLARKQSRSRSLQPPAYASDPHPDPGPKPNCALSQAPAPRAATQVGHAGARLPLRLARRLPRALRVGRPHPPRGTAAAPLRP